MGCVYKATNTVNQKSYIGFTNDMVHRKKEHHCAAFTGLSCYAFHRALRKYGWEAFRWEILEEGVDDSSLLRVREPYYIQSHNTHYLAGWGYNMTHGGDGVLGFKFTEEQKEKLRVSHLGKIHSEKSKEKMSVAHKGRKNSLRHNHNIAKAFSKKWQVIRPDGQIVIVENLKQFCRDEKLRYPGLHKVVCGMTSHHKGYKVSSFIP